MVVLVVDSDDVVLVVQLLLLLLYTSLVADLPRIPTQGLKRHGKIHLGAITPTTQTVKNRFTDDEPSTCVYTVL